MRNRLSIYLHSGLAYSASSYITSRGFVYLGEPVLLLDSIDLGDICRFVRVHFSRPIDIVDTDISSATMHPVAKYLGFKSEKAFQRGTGLIRIIDAGSEFKLEFCNPSLNWQLDKIDKEDICFDLNDEALERFVDTCLTLFESK